MVSICVQGVAVLYKKKSAKPINYSIHCLNDFLVIFCCIVTFLFNARNASQPIGDIGGVTTLLLRGCLPLLALVSVSVCVCR